MCGRRNDERHSKWGKITAGESVSRACRRALYNSCNFYVVWKLYKQLQNVTRYVYIVIQIEDDLVIKMWEIINIDILNNFCHFVANL